ncbi:aa3-type cytochrome c oxidase subunit IV [Litorimonas sp.]|jgi:hypothetical protein|uniref:aa3-type cytochrome c oxidase subunit IV n=1 Tax=Litorimonas sp. TaxID=1892381 RepID=UPI003A84C185
MAAGSSNYNRGEMNVKAQSGTFGGFMGLTKYGGALVALIVLMPTLVFAVGMGWFSALIVSLIVGFVIGVVLKFKAIWYVVLVGTAIFVGIISFLLSLLAG